MRIGILVGIMLTVNGCAGGFEKLSHDRKRDRLFAMTPKKGSSELSLKEFTLSNPNVTKKCEPWRTNGNELIEAHCIWTIQGQPKWQKAKSTNGDQYK